MGAETRPDFWRPTTPEPLKPRRSYFTVDIFFLRSLRGSEPRTLRRILSPPGGAKHFSTTPAGRASIGFPRRRKFRNFDRMSVSGFCRVPKLLGEIVFVNFEKNVVGHVTYFRGIRFSRITSTRMEQSMRNLVGRWGITIGGSPPNFVTES